MYILTCTLTDDEQLEDSQRCLFMAIPALIKYRNHYDPLNRKKKKQMATYSNILAWKIPGTVEPFWLQSMWF